MARYKSDQVKRAIHEVMGLLERLLQAAEEGERTGSVIEILVLQALVHHAQANIHRALDPLERALTLAEPEGYVRIFVDEGKPMRDLLRHAAVLIAFSDTVGAIEGGRLDFNLGDLARINLLRWPLETGCEFVEELLVFSAGLTVLKVPG